MDDDVVCSGGAEALPARSEAGRRVEPSGSNASTNYLKAETRTFIKKRIERLKQSNIPGTALPDIKERLIAVGLIDKINGDEAIVIPENKEMDGCESKVNIQEPGFVVVGSDVEKLYPSLCPLEAARMARITIIESMVDIKNVDLLKALRYIRVVGGMSLIERAGLTRIAPKWKGKS